jgi:hypothetical protein
MGEEPIQAQAWPRYRITYRQAAGRRNRRYVVGSDGYSPWTGGVNPLRKYGALGAIATMIIGAMLAISGAVPAGFDRLVIAAFMVSLLYFGMIFIVGTFRDFDRGAYPVLLGMMVIPVLLVLLLVATGVL